MKNEPVQQLKDLIQKSQKAVIIPHENPDGDAMGSTLALYQFLKKKGKETHLITPNDFPGFLKNLPYCNESLNFEKEKENAKRHIETADLIFTLDFNQLSRTRDMQSFLEGSQAQFVMIDHHQEPSDYAAINISQTKSSSTCELLYEVFERLDETSALDKDQATCLYTGILTDTGSFKFSSTTARTHRTVAHLMDLGVEPEEIHQQLFDNNSLSKLKLQALALNNLQMIENYRTSFTFLSNEEMDSLETKKGDTEGIVNIGLSLEGILFTAFFKERLDEGIIKISLRSKGEFDVNAVARKHFDGGGHKNAAGGKSERSLSETLDYFKQTVVPEYKNQLK